MRATIAFIDTTALRTRARCIAWVNANDCDPRELRFVFEKRTELKKRPTVQGSSLVASSRNSFANATPVFEDNRAMSVLREFHHMLADRMVHIFRETGFFARKFFEQTL